MRRLGVLFVLCSTAAPLSATEYSQQDVQACMWDVFRVCGYAIPDRERVRQCLFDNQNSLSKPCFDVFERGRIAARATGGQDGQKTQRPRY